MKLSTDKLRSLLAKLGYVDVRYFAFEGFCFYIELLSLKTSELFLLYIPSKYKFRIDEGGNVYKLKLLTTGVDNTDEAELAYEEKIKLDPHKSENMDEHLETQYKHEINLKDVSKDDLKQIDSIKKQLKRLKYCIQNIDYRIAITYKNYFCIVRRSDDIECYMIKRSPKGDNKKFYVTTDLEMLYNKADQIDHDITHIQFEMYKLLEKNQSLHSKVIDSILENKNNVLNVSNKMKQKREMYQSYTERLQNLLNDLIKTEEFKYGEIQALSHNNPFNFDTNIELVNKKSKLESDIFEINEIKKDISRYLNYIKQERENILLSIDDILFDNTVMIDSMLKNFESLKVFL